MQTDFAKSKRKNQSGDVENEVFEAFGLLFDLDLHVVKGQKVRSRNIIKKACFEISQFF